MTRLLSIKVKNTVEGKELLQISNIPSLIPGCRMDCHPPTRYFHTQSPCYLCWNVMQCTNPLHRTIQPRQNIENTKRSTKIKVFANCSACSIALESAVSKNYSSLLYRTFYAYFSKNSIIGYFRKILVKIQARCSAHLLYSHLQLARRSRTILRSPLRSSTDNSVLVE